jgi:putative glutamine amidotransferase
MNSSDRPLIGIPCRSDGSMLYKGRHINAQNSSYIRAIMHAGGAPFLIPVEARDQVLRTLFECADGILLTGGGDIAPQFFGEAPHAALNDVQSARDELEFALVEWALEENKPLFGICRGIQVMNVAAGGSLYQDIASQCSNAQRHDYFYSQDYPRDFMAHPVNVEPNSRLSRALSIDHLRVNSLHHQALRDVAGTYQVVCRSPDGIVEGIEMPGHPFAIGVQWHPEELVASQDAARRLFLDFVHTCQNGLDYSATVQVSGQAQSHQNEQAQPQRI